MPNGGGATPGPWHRASRQFPCIRPGLPDRLLDMMEVATGSLQKRAIQNYHARFSERGLSRFDVLRGPPRVPRDGLLTNAGWRQRHAAYPSAHRQNDRSPPLSSVHP
jgi:hypothetical protein